MSIGIMRHGKDAMLNPEMFCQLDMPILEGTVIYDGPDGLIIYKITGWDPARQALILRERENPAEKMPTLAETQQAFEKSRIW